MSLTDTQRATLRLFCDTIVPRIDHEPDPVGFWARAATDIGVDLGDQQDFIVRLAELRREIAPLIIVVGHSEGDPTSS